MGLSKNNHPKRMLSPISSTARLSRSIFIAGCVLHMFSIQGTLANQPPYFTDDMNNHVIPENTPVGTIVYTLKAVDPENSPIKYGIMGTDRLRVDEKTGIVTVAKPIDRELSDRLKVTVTVEDVVRGRNENNFVTVPVSVTISDTNDNPPKFSNQSMFENLEVIEDTTEGTRILTIEVQDPDLTGMALSLNCTPSSQSPESCQVFQVDIKEATAGILKAELRLARKLDYNKRSLYQFQLTASDGEHLSKVGVLIRIKDVQNTPPVFIGAMAGRVIEDAAVGTLVMIIQARDGDSGKPREVRLSLQTNPGEVFQLDPKTGRLTTTRPLDREVRGSLLILEVKAQEIPYKGELDLVSRADIDALETVQNVTVLIDDVNDSVPEFNKKEYYTEVLENTPIGTPLPDLDMLVTDLDTGTFADFVLRIDGPLSELFDIQPRFATGSVKPVIRVKKSFDFENPNERKFILLIVAQNTDEPEPYSTTTVTVSTIDENDNRPQFERESYSIMVPESTSPGTKIGRITAFDPDSNEFGTEGLVYQLVGSGSRQFTVNNRTGEIYVAECSKARNRSSCLDYESQKSYDLLYMASDTNKQDGFIHSIVPLKIVVSDSNDNPVYFDEKFMRIVPENTRQFEPRFFITAKDVDDSSVVTYRLLNSSQVPFFRIDENTGELLIKSNQLPPGDYTFKVEASDGVNVKIAPVLVKVTDLNNHAPSFTKKTLENRGILLPESTTAGSLVAKVEAIDKDLKENGRISYSIDKGARGFFEINNETGEIFLTKPVDNEDIPKFELLVSATDGGKTSLRSATTIEIKIENVYEKLPKMVPEVQRAQISESAEIGDFVTTITTDAPSQGLNSTALELTFELVDPVTARNLDNMPVNDASALKEWFRVDNNGQIFVGAALERDLVTTVNFTVMLTSKRSRPQLKHFGTLMITIFEVNDKAPLVDDMEIEILEELPPGQGILTIEAEDPEGGQISNYFIERGSEYFNINNKTGEIKVLGRLDYETQPMHNITVVAVDSGVPQLSSTSTIMVSLVNDNDNDPVFSQGEYDAEIDEQPSPGSLVTKVSATDLDVDSSISYEIEPGNYSKAFTINRIGEVLVSEEGSLLIDRDLMETPFIHLGVKASDGERVGYSTVRVFVRDINDNKPQFQKRSYHVNVHAPLRAKQEIIRVVANGGDLDGTDKLRYSISSGNEKDFFEVNADTGIISASQAVESSGEFSLTVDVTDGNAKDFVDQTDVVIQILPGNFRKPEFMFPNKINSTLIALESNAEEIERFAQGNYSKVLGQVLALDGDDGDAGKIMFYFKVDDQLFSETEVFKIEQETGKILQIKPLDREKINKYDLLVVAKDGGIPVSTESQHILTIQIDDIDDHSPYFENRYYEFSIKENSIENTFIGQVEAEDKDEGRNAQIFYFLVTEPNELYLKDDIRVDIKTGMLHSNAVLDRERINAYKLYVRATSSPLINKSMEIMSLTEFKTDLALARVVINVLDENDNSPRFPEKQYYAAINSDAEPGREILTLKSVDIDASSPVQYSLIGASLILDDFRTGGSVVPSPFRVNAETGRLTLSASAMRRYSGGNNRFQVKVGVRETIPPYQSDTTQVQVWVVESSQETVLTVKSSPHSLMKENLVDVLSNITDKYVLVTKITPHVNEDISVNKDWSDVYVTAIDKKTFQTVPVSQFLQALDLGHDQLLSADTPIVLQRAVPAISSTEGDGEYYSNGNDPFDTAFAGLIALLALLCMGLASIIACCCCLNRMYDKDNDSEKQTIFTQGGKYPLHASHPSIPGTPNVVRHNPSDMIEDVATDNPLWIDHKVKTYEEQELTMQVASEMDNSNGSIDDGLELEEEEDEEDMAVHKSSVPVARQQSPQFSHAYATLHHHRHPEDYDNINILGEETVAVHL